MWDTTPRAKAFSIASMSRRYKACSTTSSPSAKKGGDVNLFEGTALDQHTLIYQGRSRPFSTQESHKLREWFVWSDLASQNSLFAPLVLRVMLLINDSEFPLTHTVGAPTTR